MSDERWAVWITVANPEYASCVKVEDGMNYGDAMTRMADIISDVRNDQFIPIMTKHPYAVNPKYIIKVYVQESGEE